MPTLTLSRSQRIEQIIQQRQPLAQTLGAIAAGLTGLIDQHQYLQTYRQTLSRGTDILPDLPSIEQIIQLRDRIDTLQKRLSRKTLNIGVIGETGAGKSTLLKSLSNLTDGEIPALAGGACTAVRSTVINQAGETYATVNLHSEQSFLAEVIAPYFEQLKLGPTPRNLDEFAAFPLSDSPPEGASKEKMYQHLRDDYHQNLDRYRHLLNRSEPETITISREQIPSCATQTRDAQGQLTTFTHIGVRELTIYCPFGKDASAFGQVALVDVPGMGDTRLGDEKLMLQTLAQSVDVVLFVHRPDPLRYLWKKTTLSLYETASEALTPFDERVFMLLNYSRNNDNAKACQTLLQNLDPIQVVEASIVDCASQTETQRILDGILNYLTDHIQRLDRQSLRSPISELRTLLKTLPVKIPAAAELFQ
ncbi:MAG: dynamin family protein, partial [Cyanobacteria bacterium P01_H01_bin.15]